MKFSLYDEYAEFKITGIVRLWSRMRCSTSTPSMPGMRMSSTTRSGFSLAATLIASRPFVASSTSNPSDSSSLL
jgi:hypothetical protein